MLRHTEPFPVTSRHVVGPLKLQSHGKNPIPVVAHNIYPLEYGCSLFNGFWWMSESSL